MLFEAEVVLGDASVLVEDLNAELRAPVAEIADFYVVTGESGEDFLRGGLLDLGWGEGGLA